MQFLSTSSQESPISHSQALSHISASSSTSKSIRSRTSFDHQFSAPNTNISYSDSHTNVPVHESPINASMFQVSKVRKLLEIHSQTHTQASQTPEAKDILQSITFHCDQLESLQNAFGIKYA